MKQSNWVDVPYSILRVNRCLFNKSRGSYGVEGASGSTVKIKPMPEVTVRSKDGWQQYGGRLSSNRMVIIIDGDKEYLLQDVGRHSGWDKPVFYEYQPAAPIIKYVGCISNEWVRKIIENELERLSEEYPRLVTGATSFSDSESTRAIIDILNGVLNEYRRRENIKEEIAEQSKNLKELINVKKDYCIKVISDSDGDPCKIRVLVSGFKKLFENAKYACSLSREVESLFRSEIAELTRIKSPEFSFPSQKDCKIFLVIKPFGGGVFNKTHLCLGTGCVRNDDGEKKTEDIKVINGKKIKFTVVNHNALSKLEQLELITGPASKRIILDDLDDTGYAVRLDALNDPKSGFLQDDTLTIDIELSCSSLKNNQQPLPRVQSESSDLDSFPPVHDHSSPPERETAEAAEITTLPPSYEEVMAAALYQR